MVEFLDPAYYVAIVAAASTAIVGFIGIRNDIKKRQEEAKKHIEMAIDQRTNKIIEHVDSSLITVNERFRTAELADRENKEDIEDIEDDIKTMTSDMKEICNKLSKHDYIVEEVLPEFKTLKGDFYKFKASVETNLFNSKSSNSLLNE